MHEVSCRIQVADQESRKQLQKSIKQLQNPWFSHRNPNPVAGSKKQLQNSKKQPVAEPLTVVGPKQSVAEVLHQLWNPRSKSNNQLWSPLFCCRNWLGVAKCTTSAGSTFEFKVAKLKCQLLWIDLELQNTTYSCQKRRFSCKKTCAVEKSLFQLRVLDHTLAFTWIWIYEQFFFCKALYTVVNHHHVQLRKWQLSC
jgi:hypothetical protein